MTETWHGCKKNIHKCGITSDVWLGNRRLIHLNSRTNSYASQFITIAALLPVRNIFQPGGTSRKRGLILQDSAKAHESIQKKDENHHFDRWFSAHI
jgi:hypothetical protein